MGLTPKQLELHNKHITGSKVAAILGISPFQSKYQLFCEMAGVLEPERVETERMKFGNYAEQTMHNFCQQEFGWQLVEGPKEGRHHPKFNQFFGLVDRLKVNGNAQEAVIEFKNIDTFQYSQWEEGAPPYYECQARFYTLIYNIPSIIVALFGGNHVERYPIERDTTIENFLIKKCLEFWDDLQAGRFPDPDGHEKTGEILRQLYPKNTLDMIDGDLETLQLAREYEMLRQKEAEIKKAKQERQNRLKALIGLHDGLALPEGGKVTWKLTKSSQKFDEKTFAEENPELYAKYMTETSGYRRMYFNVPQKQLTDGREA